MSSDLPNSSKQSILANIVSHVESAYVVLVLGIVVAAVAAVWTQSQIERETRQKFETIVTEAESAIEVRIQHYADVLLGVRALFITSDFVSRGEFHDYVASFDLRRRYPGIQVIHYGQHITAAQRPAFLASIRNDSSMTPHGYPDFAIRPPGDRPEHVVVQYVEPMTGNEAALGSTLVASLCALPR